jgi:hypothetical protein
MLNADNHSPSANQKSRDLGSCIWYIESRAFNEVDGKPAKIPSGVVKGSGVVVRLEELELEERDGQSFWKPKDPPRFKKYLLTCAHVVREFEQRNSGWGPLLGEILCWRPGGHYSHWQTNDVRPRFSGESDAIGALKAKVFRAPILDLGTVNLARATAPNDWVLLEVEDGITGSIDQAAAAECWGGLSEESKDLAVIGYPGGDYAWKHNEKVIPHTSDGFRVMRIDQAGHVSLVGQDETRPGMSGGAIFDASGALVGLHRGVSDKTLEFQPVPATVIREWLMGNGYRPAAMEDPGDSAGIDVKAQWVGIGTASETDPLSSLLGDINRLTRNSLLFRFHALLERTRHNGVAVFALSSLTITIAAILLRAAFTEFAEFRLLGRPYRAVSSYVDLGLATLLVILTFFITSVKGGELARTSEWRRNRTGLLRAFQGGVIRIDANDEILEGNDRAEELFEKQISKTDSDLVQRIWIADLIDVKRIALMTEYRPEPAVVICTFQDVRSLSNRGQPCRFYARLARSPGWVQFRGAPIITIQAAEVRPEIFFVVDSATPEECIRLEGAARTR